MTAALVIRNSGGELLRTTVKADDMGDFNLPQLVAGNYELRLALEMLQVGDTITLEEVRK